MVRAILYGVVVVTEAVLIYCLWREVRQTIKALARCIGTCVKQERLSDQATDKEEIEE